MATSLVERTERRPIGEPLVTVARTGDVVALAVADAAGGWAVALAAVAVLAGPAGVGVVLGGGVRGAGRAGRLDGMAHGCTDGRGRGDVGVHRGRVAPVGAYGVHHADPATSVLAVVGVLADGAMLLRKLVSRHRRVVLMAR